MTKLIDNKNIIYELVRRKIKTQYRNSILGALWTVLNPLLNMLVMWLVFSQFFGRNDPTYHIYLFTGNIMFACLRASTDTSLTSIVNNRGLLSKIKIDSYVFPLSSTIASFISFLFSFIALIIIMICTQFFGGYSLFSFRIFAVLLMIPAFIVFEYGLSLLLSAVYVFCRDIKYIYSVFLTLLMYLTPIFWKINSLKVGSFAYKVVHFNPMFYFVNFFREAMYLGFESSIFSSLITLYLIAIVTFAVGTLIFKLLKNKFITNL